MKLLICTRPSVASAKAICVLVEELRGKMPGAIFDILVAVKDRISKNSCRVVVEQYFGEETAWSLSPERHLVVNKLERIARNSGGSLFNFISKSNDDIHRFLLTSEWSLAISYNFSYIFNDADIQHLSGQIINVHSGPIPEMRGVNPVFWTMLGGKSDHCATIHKIIRQVDAGPIIGRTPCEVTRTRSLVSNRMACYLSAVPKLCEVAAIVRSGGEVPAVPMGEKVPAQLPKIGEEASRQFFDNGMRAVSVDDLIEFQRWLTL